MMVACVHTLTSSCHLSHVPSRSPSTSVTVGLYPHCSSLLPALVVMTAMRFHPPMLPPVLSDLMSVILVTLEKASSSASWTRS
jgi:hypothetical protein